jgi:signal transduction histidine kinase/CHASE3 domain sensor protein
MPSSSPNLPGNFRRVLSRNLTLPLALGVASAIVFLSLLAYLAIAIREVQRSDELLSHATEVQRLDLDMESGLRGFLLEGDERFLQPYEQAARQVQPALKRLQQETFDPVQQKRLERIEQLQARWSDYAGESIARKRKDPQAAVSADTGRELRDEVRAEFDHYFAAERRARATRIEEASRNTLITAIAFVLFMVGTGGLVAWRGRKDLMGLADTYEGALQEQRRQAEVLQGQAWLREGQAQLSQRLALEQDVTAIGRAALEFLSQYLGIAVGALYLPEPPGFVRAATWGWSPAAEGAGGRIPQERTLVAESAAQRRQIALDPVPAGYLQVSSALGAADAAAVLIAPLEHEGRLAGVLEIGMLRPLEPRDGELLSLASGVLGASLEAARYRKRLQDVLEESQQLNEELQVQQEELRTANEELEEQSRALKESQAHLENQQAELEQTNLQLAEQTDRLEQQRDQLREAQVQLEQRAQEVQRASRYKSEFLANMSHELRTPLNSSLILARLLADNAEGNLSEEQVKFAESIHTAGNDLLNLINDILDIAKVEAGKLEMRPEVTSLAGVAESLKSMFEPLAARKGLQLAVSVAPEAPALHVHRPASPGADPAQPAVQCRQVHRPWQRGTAHRAGRGRAHLLRGARHRRGHRSRAPGPGLRGFPPGRRHQQPQVRRHRPGPVDLARPRAPAGRRHLGTEHARQGQHLHRGPP